MFGFGKVSHAVPEEAVCLDNLHDLAKEVSFFSYRKESGHVNLYYQNDVEIVTLELGADGDLKSMDVNDLKDAINRNVKRMKLDSDFRFEMNRDISFMCSELERLIKEYHQN